MMDFSAYSTFSGRDSWPPNTSERGLGNQTTITGKYQQLPWQSNSQTCLPDLLQGSTTRPSYSGPGEDCFSGVSDSSSALSLLSNEPWASRSHNLSLGVNNFLGANGTAIVQPSVGQFSCPSWDFKGNQANNSLHQMPSDVGLPQISHPSNSQYSGDIRLAQPNDRQYHELEPSEGYDSSVQHMNWSL